MKEKATIFDYARMCKNTKVCDNCPLGINNTLEGITCSYLVREIPDKANEIILNWCKEHPVETRQDRFVKMFPNAKMTSDGLVGICPQGCDKQWECGLNIDSSNIENVDCTDCLEKYWLAEVGEDE